MPKNIKFTVSNNQAIFHCLIQIQINRKNYLKSYNKLNVPKKWQLILMNDGSLTQNLNSFTGSDIYIHICQNFNQVLVDKNNIRSIYLEDKNNTKLVFAKSLWPINSLIFDKFKMQAPVGKLFIKYKQDIYKEINEIYYGYSKYLNCYFNTNKPIWGRKCSIYYKKSCIVTIYEFFSPDLIKFFKIAI